jgi:hypothetical protein
MPSTPYETCQVLRRKEGNMDKGVPREHHQSNGFDLLWFELSQGSGDVGECMGLMVPWCEKFGR